MSVTVRFPHSRFCANVIFHNIHTLTYSAYCTDSRKKKIIEINQDKFIYLNELIIVE